MKRIATVSIIVLIAIFACGGLQARATAQTPEGVDLAQLDGWDIVISDDAIASEVYAAEEFQEFFSQASGLKLPIVHKIDRSDRHVFIGLSKMLQASNLSVNNTADFGDEDLRIVIRDGNIAIAGGRPRGTLYGVYTFLEDYLGVRFLTHDHTHVPVVGENLAIGPLDRVYRPPFANNRNAVYKAWVQRQFPIPGHNQWEGNGYLGSWCHNLGHRWPGVPGIRFWLWW